MSALILWFTLLGVTPADCGDAFAQGLKQVERAAAPARVGPALAALGACDRLGALAKAAREAAQQPRSKRESSLIAASGIARRCALERCQALPAPLEMAPRALADADAGTYAFAIAAHKALVDAGLLTPTSERILMNLLLGSALEGEAQRNKGR